MSASMLAYEPVLPAIPVMGSKFRDRGGWRRDRSLFSMQRAVVEEMLSTLDTLTAAGQRYIMGKIVAFIRDHISSECGGASWRNQRMLAELLDQLAREGESLWPNPGSFSDRAQNLVALLAATA